MVSPDNTESANPSENNEGHSAARRQRGKKKGRVSIACTLCRSQHLRCDAEMPTCTRCQSLRKTCVYTDIRRRRRICMSDDLLLGTTRPCDDEVPTENSQYPNHASPAVTMSHDAQQELNSIFATISDDLFPVISTGSNSLFASRPLDGFYTYFFPGHPFILPKAQLICHTETDPDTLSELIRAIMFIGSLYTHDRLSDRHRQAAERVEKKELLPNGFTVQTLMLLALYLEWSGEGQRASWTLERAKSVALTIELNNQSFAVKHGRGNAVLEESWRRTWWELYAIDALFAGIRHWPTFSLWTIATDTNLPTEEDYYITGAIPQSRTLQEYDDRGFEENDGSFSSFTYLIDAARILGTVLAAGDVIGGSPSSLVKNSEANIMSWHLHLPKSKRDSVRPNGTVDEVLFRSHMMINTAAMHLHRPRSILHYSTMELLCSRYAPPLPAEVLPPEEHLDRHTQKAIRAAKTFVDLLSVPSSPMTHSPFIMCMGSMAMATHLSACEYRLTGSEYMHAKDRVRVFLGILKIFENIWPQASKWSGEIRLMAKAVFESRDSSGRLIPASSRPAIATAGGSYSGPNLEGLNTISLNETMGAFLEDMANA